MNKLKINISKNFMPHKSFYHLIILSSYHLICITFCFLLLSCGNKSSDKPSVSDIKNPATPEGVDQRQLANMPEIEFDNFTYDFGKVIRGERLSYTFHFKNIGKSSLLISCIEASCGCTTSVPPKAPIRPGEKGTISITFDSSQKMGDVISYLVVTANTYPAQTVLTVQANVINP
jgi:hypothetical protein